MASTDTIQTVTSADGTTIAVDVAGSGPAVVLVSGGSVDRGSNAGLAAALQADFTVYNYDRRGRGDSGDTAPYAVEREIEDIAAVIALARGHAHLYGSSSGAGLALEAAASGAAVDRLVLWEPPYNLDPAGRPPADSVEQLDRMVREGRRGDAAEFFMARMVRLPAEFVGYARTQPWWAAQEAIAHTLAYDARVMGDYSVPTATAGRIAVPTIILTGGNSFDLFKPTS
ncbi:MAG: alpha/beta fold hydrolase, partial [Candidatus Limnocylindrales bacterium]